MKVKQLIKFLRGIPPDMEVYMSSDEEGNSYSPLDESGFGLILVNKVTGDVCCKGDEGIDEEIDTDEGEEPYEECLVLYPGY